MARWDVVGVVVDVIVDAIVDSIVDSMVDPMVDSMVDPMVDAMVQPNVSFCFFLFHCSVLGTTLRVACILVALRMLGWLVRCQTCPRFVSVSSG